MAQPCDIPSPPTPSKRTTRKGTDLETESDLNRFWRHKISRALRSPLNPVRRRHDAYRCYRIILSRESKGKDMAEDSCSETLALRSPSGWKTYSNSSAAARKAWLQRHERRYGLFDDDAPAISRDERKDKKVGWCPSLPPVPLAERPRAYRSYCLHLGVQEASSDDGSGRKDEVGGDGCLDIDEYLRRAMMGCSSSDGGSSVASVGGGVGGPCAQKRERLKAVEDKIQSRLDELKSGDTVGEAYCSRIPQRVVSGGLLENRTVELPLPSMEAMEKRAEWESALRRVQRFSSDNERTVSAETRRPSAPSLPALPVKQDNGESLDGAKSRASSTGFLQNIRTRDDAQAPRIPSQHKKRSQEPTRNGSNPVQKTAEDPSTKPDRRTSPSDRLHIEPEVRAVMDKLEKDAVDLEAHMKRYLPIDLATVSTRTDDELRPEISARLDRIAVEAGERARSQLRKARAMYDFIGDYGPRARAECDESLYPQRGSARCQSGDGRGGSMRRRNPKLRPGLYRDSWAQTSPECIPKQIESSQTSLLMARSNGKDRLQLVSSNNNMARSDDSKSTITPQKSSTTQQQENPNTNRTQGTLLASPQPTPAPRPKGKHPANTVPTDTSSKPPVSSLPKPAHPDLSKASRAPTSPLLSRPAPQPNTPERPPPTPPRNPNRILSRPTPLSPPLAPPLPIRRLPLPPLRAQTPPSRQATPKHDAGKVQTKPRAAKPASKTGDPEKATGIPVLAARIRDGRAS